MDQTIIKQLHQLIEQRNQNVVDNQLRGEANSLEARKFEMHQSRGAEIVRSYVEGDIIRSTLVDDQLTIDYVQQTEQLIQLKEQMYLEEQLELRRAFFRDGELEEDISVMHEIHEEAEKNEPLVFSETREVEEERTFSYNRREAVRYAERWWNDYNPVYKKFKDNCTNYISQCVRAGGAPMSGSPNRSKGWWYQTSNWSFSWSVAHSFRWYLSGAKSGLRGEEKASASELEPGDVICYDFNGDGRWQHTTIVVAKDANDEPLVNAQTTNSRMRYWKYEDSTAWTPNIKYKFFHIVG